VYKLSKQKEENNNDMMNKKEIEKELQAWTNGNRKDIICILGQNLLFSKDPIARAEAWRQLNKIIEYYEDPNSP
jgi:hypothetical protein